MLTHLLETGPPFHGQQHSRSLLHSRSLSHVAWPHKERLWSSLFNWATRGSSLLQCKSQHIFVIFFKTLGDKFGSRGLDPFDPLNRSALFKISRRKQWRSTSNFLRKINCDMFLDKLKINGLPIGRRFRVHTLSLKIIQFWAHEESLYARFLRLSSWVTHIQSSAFWMPDCRLNWDKTIKAGAKLDIL